LYYIIKDYSPGDGKSTGEKCGYEETESQRVKFRRFWPFHRVTFGSPDE